MHPRRVLVPAGGEAPSGDGPGTPPAEVEGTVGQTRTATQRLPQCKSSQLAEIKKWHKIFTSLPPPCYLREAKASYHYICSLPFILVIVLNTIPNLLKSPFVAQRHSSFTTQLVRSHGRLTHKRSTLEILMRGKLVGASESQGTPSAAAAATAGAGSQGSAATPQTTYAHPHRFDRYNFTTPSYCDLCSNVLWGPVKVSCRCT